MTHRLKSRTEKPFISQHIMQKTSLASTLFILLFGMNPTCHAQAASTSPACPAQEARTEADDCEGWRTVAAGHWNNRIYRLQWKYPEAPWFGDLPPQVQDFVVKKYCHEGVDWVSDHPELVKNIMERKWKRVK